MIGAVTRVTWSVDPPAPQGTIMLIGASGFQSCAEADPASASPDSVPSRIPRALSEVILSSQVNGSVSDAFCRRPCGDRARVSRI